METNISSRSEALVTIRYVGNGHEAAVQVDRFPYLIGRDSSSVQLTLPDATVSRTHAQLTYQNGVVLLENISQTNKTSVNGCVVEQPVQLNSGDQAIMGSCRLTFEIQVRDFVKAGTLEKNAGKETLSVSSGQIIQERTKQNNIKQSDIRYCWKCGKVLQSDAAFCADCGASPDVKIDGQAMFCGSCGAKVGRDFKFCRRCGKPAALEANQSDASNPTLVHNSIPNKKRRRTALVASLLIAVIAIAFLAFLGGHSYETVVGQYGGISDDGLFVSLTLNKDGTAETSLFGISTNGIYEIKRSEIIVTVSMYGLDSSIQGQIDGNEIRFADVVLKKDVTSPAVVNVPETADDQDNNNEDFFSEVFNVPETKKYDLIYIDDTIDRKFSEGRAWVKYKGDNDDICIGVIDGKGQIVYSVSPKDLNEKAQNGKSDFDIMTTNNIVTSHFTDWTSYFTASTGEFVIVDGDGNELFSSDDGDENTHFYMLGYGEKQFLVGKHTETFSENTKEIYTIDKIGNVIHKYSGTDEVYFDNFIYLGDGIMAGTESHYSSYNYIFNLNTGEYFSLPVGVYLQTPFYNGIAVTGSGYLISSDNLKNKSTMETAFNEGRWKHLPELEPFHDYNKNDFATYSEGVFYVKDAGYYTPEGQLSVSLPVFPEKVEIRQAGAFHGGYAPLYLGGSDGKGYITMIDKSGTVQYDPVEISNYDYDLDDYHDKGYYLVEVNDKFAVIYPDGTVKYPGESDMSDMDFDTAILGKKWMSISDGYYRDDRLNLSMSKKSYYINLKDGSRIDFAIVN